MELTAEEKQIVRRASAELGKSLAAAGVPDDRWSVVTLAVVADLSRQALDLHEPAPTEREPWQR